MPPKGIKSAGRPKSAGAVVDDDKQPLKKQVTFNSRIDIPDDLFVAILCRIADDVRLSPSTFPPPEEGYPQTSWPDRVASGPVEKALRTVATELHESGGSDSDAAAKRLVELLFSLGLTDFRARGEPEDMVKALDGRAILVRV